VSSLLRSKLFWLAVAGFGSAAGVCAWQWDMIKSNPAYLGVAALAGAAVAPLGAFVKKVWGHLEPKWASSLADWLDAQVQLALSGFRRRYYRQLVYRHRVFNVRGLRTLGTVRLELDRVFVDLRVAPRNPLEATADPLHAEVLQGNRSIWDFLASPQSSYHCLAIIGPPGSGKTTLLQHIVLAMAQHRQRRFARRCPAMVPVFLFLREHAAALAGDKPPSLADLIAEAESKDGLRPPAGWFQKQLDAQHCLILLDGLDEVGDAEQRQKVVAWVDHHVELHGGNRFLVTSRVHGYKSNPLARATVVEVQPFSLEQVQRFVEGWYLENEILSAVKDDPGIRADAARKAADLLRRLRETPSLSALAVNPLLLTMIATVHRYRAALPGRRVELYSEICDVFLEHRQRSKSLPIHLTAFQIRSVLQPLAYQMMKQHKRELPIAEAVKLIREPLERLGPTVARVPADFLHEVESGSGLLLEREAGVISFAHLTFQEYFAACHLLEGNPRTARAIFKTSAADSWWRETIRLYAAQGDASPILRVLLDSAAGGVAALTLAYECLSEARSVEPALRDEVQRQIIDGLESSERERAHLAGEVLLTLRMNYFLRIGDTVEIDTGFISQAEYQLFIDDMQPDGKYYQPDHWDRPRFLPGKALQPITGVRYSDAVAFCQWLTKRAYYHGETETRFRLPKPEEADQHPVGPPTHEQFRSLHGSQTGTWCIDATLSALGGPPELRSLWASAAKAVVASWPLAALAKDRLARHPATSSLQLDSIAPLSVAGHENLAETVQSLGYEMVRALGLDSEQLRNLLLEPKETNDPASSTQGVLVLDLRLAMVRRLLEVLKEARNRGENGHQSMVLLRTMDYAMRQTTYELLTRHTKNEQRHRLLKDVVGLMIRIAGLFDEAALQCPLPVSQSLWERIRQRVRRMPSADEPEFCLVRNAYLDSAIRLSLLQERIAGRLPLWEGIRVVREHVSAQQQRENPS
jgi:hypothetical protein